MTYLLEKVAYMFGNGSRGFRLSLFQWGALCALLIGLLGATPPSSRPSSSPSSQPTKQDSPIATTLSLPLVGRVPLHVDPITTRTYRDIVVVSHVMETLVTLNHKLRPAQLHPLLLAHLPTVSKDQKTYTFALRKGAVFHDHPCFPKGKGREVQSDDVLFSLKRMANQAHRPTPRHWWLLKGKIEGLDAFRKQQFFRRFAGKSFQHFAPVSGLKRLDAYRFQIKLTRALPQFVHILAHPGMSIVPREIVTCPLAVRKVSPGFPIGTGPYRFKSWAPGQSIELVQHERYWGSKQQPRLPRTPKLKLLFQPDFATSWHSFTQGRIAYTQLSPTGAKKVLSTTKYPPVLKKQWKKRGYKLYRQPFLDFIYTGFNFRDPIVGGTSKRALYLRKALAHAIDYNEFNRRFYSNSAVVYQGAIPPGLSGYAGQRPKPDLKKARMFLKKAGYPGGKGLPTLVISTSLSREVKLHEAEMKRQFAKVGVKIRYQTMPFPQLAYKLRMGKTQMFSLAWGSDYPDSENNLMLFVGKNKAPGPNSWSYDNPRYNKLFEKAIVEKNFAAQARMYRQLNQMLIDDAVFLGSMARVTYYVTQPKLQHFRPHAAPTPFWKYLSQPAKR